MGAREQLEALALEAEWDLFMRIIGALWTAAWLEGASALLALNDPEDGAL